MLQAPGCLIPMGPSPWNKSGTVTHPLSYSFGQRYQQGRVSLPVLWVVCMNVKGFFSGMPCIRGSKKPGPEVRGEAEAGTVSLCLCEAGGSLHETGCHCCVAGVRDRDKSIGRHVSEASDVHSIQLCRLSAAQP